MVINTSSLWDGLPMGEVAALNAVWFGKIKKQMLLPQFGHLFLLFPIGDTAVTCGGVKVDADHYLLLSDREKRPLTVQKIGDDAHDCPLLLLLLSPGFIQEMADFLNIPTDFRQLLDGMPLPKGDTLSRALDMMVHLLTHEVDLDELEELDYEVIGWVLQFMRSRHQALLKLNQHKKNTIDDLLPRLLQARQFIEASYLQSIKTEDVANHIALSEFHFARLFKTAFATTVHQYVLQLRLNEARRLLAQPQKQVTEIAFTVGYQSLSAFINAFRKQYGVSPSKYRAKWLPQN